MYISTAYLRSGFQTSIRQISKGHCKKMEKLQCGAVGGCEVAGGALGGNGGDGEGEKV